MACPSNFLLNSGPYGYAVFLTFLHRNGLKSSEHTRATNKTPVTKQL